MKMSAHQSTEFSETLSVQTLSEQPVCLLVEDCAFDRKRVNRILSDAKFNMTVVEASSVSTARKEMAERNIGIILLDNNLNDGLGLVFARELQQLGKEGEPPIVMLAEQKDDTLREAAIEAGCVGFVSKEELTAEGLSRTIRMALDAKRNASLALDPENAKQLRQVLQEEMRDMIIEVNSSVLRISRLSRKLQKDVANPVLSEHKIHAAEIQSLSEDLHRKLNTVIAEGVAGRS